MDFRTARITDAKIISAILAQRYTASLHCFLEAFLDAPACMLVSYRPLALTFLRHLSVAQTSKMSSLDGALLPDETSGPQRVFEGDLVVPLMSPWDLSASEARELLPSAALAALGFDSEEA